MASSARASMPAARLLGMSPGGAPMRLVGRQQPYIQGALLRVSVAEVQRCAAAWLQQQLDEEQQQPAPSPANRTRGPPFPSAVLEDWGPWKSKEVCIEGLAVSFTRTQLRGPATATTTAAAAAATGAAGYVDTVDIDDGTGVISCRWVWGPPHAACARTAEGGPSGGPPASSAAGRGAPMGPPPPLIDLGSFLRAEGRLLLRRSSGCSCSVKAWLQLSRPPGGNTKLASRGPRRRMSARGPLTGGPPAAVILLHHEASSEASKTRGYGGPPRAPPPLVFSEGLLRELLGLKMVSDNLEDERGGGPQRGGGAPFFFNRRDHKQQAPLQGAPTGV
ncbi:hypothetical protein Emag_004506 [Eimeria magna]